LRASGMSFRLCANGCGAHLASFDGHDRCLKKRILSYVRHQDWFAAIDLKDVYFHVSILPRHRPFLRFAFEGRAYQYQVLPFGQSLSPCVFTKLAECALAPLWEQGIRILNYLDDWLIMAHSRDLLCQHRDLVLQHLSHLGLRVNWEKSKLSPVQSISFLGMELDSVNMTARLTNEHVQSMLNCLKLFRHKTAAPGAYGSCNNTTQPASNETTTALATQRILRWAWHRGTFRVGVTPECRLLFSPWSDPAFLRAGVPLGQVSRHVVVNTDASTTGWGAVCNGQAASSSWTGPRLRWHVNCLELLAVFLTLHLFLPMLRHKHVLVRTDSTVTVVYINHQEGLRSRRILLWSQMWLKLLRAVHIPEELKLMRSHDSSPILEKGDCTPRTRWHTADPGGFEPPCTDLVQDQGGRGTGSAGCTLLAHPNLVCRPHASRDSPSLENSPKEGPSFSGDGHDLAPAPRPVEPPRVAPGQDAADLAGLPQAVVDTITQARAPSTDSLMTLRPRPGYVPKVSGSG
ncbi:hypothetical protein M9458_043818, partial [Cirrhinus mrigala]